MKTFRQTIITLALVIVLVSCAQGTSTATPRPTRAPVSPELAVQFMLESLQSNGPVGYMVGMPTMVRGQVMPYREAFELVNGRPLDSNTRLGKQPERLVWLIVTRAQWLLHIPGAHGDPLRGTPTIMGKDITVPDLWNMIIFDAATGDTFESGGVNETRRATLGELPVLPMPAPIPTP